MGGEITVYPEFAIKCERVEKGTMQVEEPAHKFKNQSKLDQVLRLNLGKFPETT